MSGGSYDYAFVNVEEMAGELINQKDELRRIFGDHLLLVAKAMRDIEWVDSCDTSKGSETEAINACLVNPKEKCLEKLEQDAEELIKKLKNLFH